MPKKKRASVCQKRKYGGKKKQELIKDDVCQVINGPPMEHQYSAPSELEEMERCDEFEDWYTITRSNLQTSDKSMDSDVSEDIYVPLSEQTIEVETVMSPFQILCQDLQACDFLNTNYVVNLGTDTVKIMEMYHSSPGRSGVKLSVVIDAEFHAVLFVHRKEVPLTHPCWNGMPTEFTSAALVEDLMRRLSTFSVCFGNPDEDFQSITPVDCDVSSGITEDIIAYREGDFCATKGDVSYSSCIRSVNCTLMVEGNRCKPCQEIRRILRQRRLREEESRANTQEKNLVHSRMAHKVMSRETLITKIKQQREEIKSLSSEVDRLKKVCDKEIKNKGIKLETFEGSEMKDLMASCREDVERTFSDENCFQRLFWDQQHKYANAGKNGMRWHPMIIRWCLYIRSKSAEAYSSMRDTGFIKLPSARTLFDYSHYTKSALGFQPDVVKVLCEEAKKLGMMEDQSFKCYTGILFDEIKIKEDLVYDKHTGELIGYCNLDAVGNQLLELEKTTTNSSPELAKCMLVIMVRGIATSLKFPLAGFATNSITADYLYPIIWKAVSVVEVNVGLKVLFFTCDGASANRKFFSLHKLDGYNETVYSTPNPHDNTRAIYFISDVPHLLKTTRNCFSNSFSHKKTRQLWKDGKDISWMHVVRLFEEQCEQSLYTPCPKLTRAHVDLTAYSCMKVSLAAQVLSGTVSNALEEYYGQEVSETVKFIRIFNKFFDCLNVRHLMEGRNKRNPDINPYRGVDDPRISWLRNDFLGYIKEWERNVETRDRNLTAAQKAAMQLSHQTKTGLEISVKSITKCIEFMLEEGADFVLTHSFNQDPLEQYFGHLRHKGGCNQNPTVNDVRNTMTQLLATRTQALAPKRGNITRLNDENVPVINNQPLPKRKK